MSNNNSNNNGGSSGGGGGVRKSTPRGQMTRGGNSGPAVMLMPPEIRSTFMPNPPLNNIPRQTLRRKQKWSGVSQYLIELAKKSEKSGSIASNGGSSRAPSSIREQRIERRRLEHRKRLEPEIELYRKEQRECGGEFNGMNCYNTLFVGRLAYEVTERKLLREMEAFGPVKDIRIVYEKDTGSKPSSRGYAFVEYEHEEDMKRAYRAADGMKMEGREIVVDVERGHTVPTWLPRRLGGGLGGTRLGGAAVNVTRPGRHDPALSMAIPPTSLPPFPPVPRPAGAPGNHPSHNHAENMAAPPLPPMDGRGGHHRGPQPSAFYPNAGTPRGGGPPHPSFPHRPGPPHADRPPPPARDWDHHHPQNQPQHHHHHHHHPRGAPGGSHYGGDHNSGRDFRKRPRSRSPESRYGGGYSGRRR